MTFFTAPETLVLVEWESLKFSSKITANLAAPLHASCAHDLRQGGEGRSWLLLHRKFITELTAKTL